MPLGGSSGVSQVSKTYQERDPLKSTRILTFLSQASFDSKGFADHLPKGGKAAVSGVDGDVTRLAEV